MSLYEDQIQIRHHKQLTKRWVCYFNLFKIINKETFQNVSIYKGRQSRFERCFSLVQYLDSRYIWCLKHGEDNIQSQNGQSPELRKEHERS
jgi:hypothetical protein